MLRPCSETNSRYFVPVRVTAAPLASVWMMVEVQGTLFICWPPICATSPKLLPITWAGRAVDAARSRTGSAERDREKCIGYLRS